MTFPPPIRRQSGMINVREDIPSDSNPLDKWKDARISLPYQNELVDGIVKDKPECIKCKYDYKEKRWTNDLGERVEISIWKKSS